MGHCPFERRASTCWPVSLRSSKRRTSVSLSRFPTDELDWTVAQEGGADLKRRANNRRRSGIQSARYHGAVTMTI
jgi:hypothetical protein